MREEFEEHRRFLNRYYGWMHHVYDMSRRFFLFGRDAAIARVLKVPGNNICEVGVGTGRNLKLLHRARPKGRYVGIDASDVMLAEARKNCPFARIENGFAESVDYHSLCPEGFDVILFSYSLSMFLTAPEALMQAYKGLRPGGVLVVCDFAHMVGGKLLDGPLGVYLAKFRVKALDEKMFEVFAEKEIAYGPLRYYLIAVVRKS